MKRKITVMVVLVSLILGMLSTTALALSYNDVASEFMCQCGCNLVLKDCDMMNCSVKDNLKGTINGMIKSGQTKAQIVKVIRTNYKDQVLSAPPKEGFNLTAYITPFLLVLAGGIGILFIVRGWVKKSNDEGETAAGSDAPIKPKKSKKYSDKLNKELDDIRWY